MGISSSYSIGYFMVSRVARRVTLYYLVLVFIDCRGDSSVARRVVDAIAMR